METLLNLTTAKSWKPVAYAIVTIAAGAFLSRIAYHVITSKSV